MFKLLKTLPALPGQVEIKTQVAPGVTESQHVLLLFRQLPEQEHVALVKQIETGKVYDLDIAEKVVCGWVDVGDEDGKPVEFTPENFASLLAIPGASAPIVRQYFELRSGRAEEKNSQKSADTSPEPAAA